MKNNARFFDDNFQAAISIREFLARLNLESTLKLDFENFHSPRETEILSESLLSYLLIELSENCVHWRIYLPLVLVIVV